ncbi:hypothetical protein GGS23DRAFT_308991 [Durotheca rogersii]|uniref:uncharacterized protein n=1 Tax=Durotheca rogersii TaxID=419775 RepID=UPI00221FD732|nr:uncharacterized protein GGS23DRAFT_308991 [Durotheca rogersii]KAI5859657.1 hypothetical protein GGS23DRAFT_308991 [Durotheca rogersii]
MSSALLLRGRDVLSAALHALRPHPGRRGTSLQLVLVTGSLVAVSVPLAAYAYKSYQAFLAIGRGGVPYNFFGWLGQSTLHLIARRDTQRPVPGPFGSIDDLAALYSPAAGRSYLGPGVVEEGRLARRGGPRPDIPRFVAPQRQTSDVATPAVLERQARYVAAVAAANPDLFELRTSQLEGPPHQALWLRLPSATAATAAGGPPPQENKDERQKTQERERELGVRLGRGTKGEFAHVHGEGSTHATLCPRDAAALIDAGWAERHGLSGVGGPTRAMAPWGYVMLYAPRDDAEFRLWREALLAAARYVAEGSGVVVVAPPVE